MSSQRTKELRGRRHATTTTTATAEEPLDGGSRTEEVEEKTPEIGVLDVVKAIAPLLVIIGLAVGMLVLGYLFVPETLSTGYFQLSSSGPPASEPPPPSVKEGCKMIGGAKALITALKDFTRWRELGSALGLPPGHLDAIEEDNEEAELRKRAMLRAWLGRQGEGHACWEPLLGALAALGERLLAKNIAQTHSVHWTFS